MDLVNVIVNLENQMDKLRRERYIEIKEIELHYDKLISGLQQSRDENLKRNTVCVKCGGTGKIKCQKVSNETSITTKPCYECDGTGKSMEEKVLVSKVNWEQFVDDSIFLDYLKDSGVENWEGYGAALAWRDGTDDLR